MMMTKSYSHYESLNVTSDAPTEVIRAAYRSLSQKYHPDKNIGNHDAEQMMMRLNAAYSVLSDSDQRNLYDLQLLSEDAPSKSKAATLVDQIRKQTKGWDGRIVTMMVGGFSVALIAISWLIWKDNQSMLQIERGMTYTPEVASAPETGWANLPTARNDGHKSGSGKAARVGEIQLAGPSGLDPVTAEQPAPAAAPKAPAAPAPAAKISEYARLTEMLKGMGLGLHKLDMPGLASNTKPAAAKAAEPVKAPEAAKASAAPSASAAAPLAASDSSRAREEAVRTAAPDPVRSDAKSVADAGKASAPLQVASAAPLASANLASASHAPRAAVIADARSCVAPAYPLNAYRNGETGTVLLALLLGSDGKVIESKVQKSSGWSDLDKAARKALSLCKFKPAEGQTEPAWANLAFVWSID
jgi:TonB family protein